MDLEEREIHSQSIGDANLLNCLPNKSDMIKSGLIASISFCDGKSTKAVFDYMLAYPDFTIEFHPQGVIFKEILMYKSGCIDTASYVIFKGDKQLEYNFCPQNIPGDGDKSHICIKVNSATISSYVKKNKATTLVRFELNVNSSRIIVNVINGGVIIPYYLEYKVVPMATFPIPSKLADPNTPANLRITSELFSAAMVNVGMKYNNVLYDFNINIFNDGIYVRTDAPGVGGIPHGKVDGSSINFQVKNNVAKRLAKICKISPRTPVTITAIDENVFKIWSNVGSYAEIIIYQYPNPDASISCRDNSVNQHVGFQLGYQMPSIQPVLSGISYGGPLNQQMPTNALSSLVPVSSSIVPVTSSVVNTVTSSIVPISSSSF